MKKKFLTMLLLVVILFGAMQTQALATIGVCGENVAWTLQPDGYLRIYLVNGANSGTMDDWADKTKTPWYSSWQDIKEVYIASGVSNVGDYAFNYCPNIEKVTLPEGLQTIGKYAFNRCGKISSIKIPDSVTTIKEYAFAETGLLSVELPASVAEIGRGVFYECKALKSADILGSLSVLTRDTFYNCAELVEVQLPDSLTEIGTGAFAGCGKLTEVNIPAGVTALGESSFSSCLSLKKVNVPEGVTIIPMSCFRHCDSLEEIELPAGLTFIDRQAFELSGLRRLEIPAGVTDFRTHAASDCPNLEEVIFHNGLERLEDQVFLNDTKLKSVYLPQSLKEISWRAFNNTSSDLQITYEGSEENWNKMKELHKIQPDNIDLIVNQNVICLNKSPESEPGNPEQPEEPGQPGTPGQPGEPEQPVRPDGTYAIGFDTAGGVLAAGVKNPTYIAWGSSLEMPKAAKSGYTLKHWQNKADSSQTYGLNGAYKFSADTNLIAVWEYIGGSSGGGGSRRPTSSKPAEETTKPTTETKEPAAAKRFSDVASGAWYAEYVSYATEKGLMNGYDDGNFGPNDHTTRAQIVTILYRLEGEPATRSASSFSDVSAGGQYYSGAVAWAAANNIVNGYEDGRFGPNDKLTREQIAAVLYRYAVFKGAAGAEAADADLSQFADFGQVSGWAQDAVRWAVGAGLLNGDNGSLKPQGNATRAEIAAMLMRYCENVAK